MMITTVNKKVL